MHCFPACPDVVAHARWLAEAESASTSQKVVEPLAPFQRFDSQPHPRSNVEVSNVLLQEVCQMMFLNWFHLEQLASM
ncbi:hypothetical protein WJX79_010326 [Trebouxia sp. C0005]